MQRLDSIFIFINGGIHPRFGTHNITAPLVGNQYIEVFCSLDHPVTEAKQWSKIVQQKTQA
jgi:hypothetical protein